MAGTKYLDFFFKLSQSHQKIVWHIIGYYFHEIYILNHLKLAGLGIWITIGWDRVGFICQSLSKTSKNHDFCDFTLFKSLYLHRGWSDPRVPANLVSPRIVLRVGMHGWDFGNRIDLTGWCWKVVFSWNSLISAVHLLRKHNREIQIWLKSLNFCFPDVFIDWILLKTSLYTEMRP